MSDDVKLYWHPGFGAVLAIEADSDLAISDVLAGCSLTAGLSSKDVRFVKRRRGFWRCLTGWLSRRIQWLGRLLKKV